MAAGWSSSSSCLACSGLLTLWLATPCCAVFPVASGSESLLQVAAYWVQDEYSLSTRERLGLEHSFQS